MDLGKLGDLLLILVSQHTISPFHGACVGVALDRLPSNKGPPPMQDHRVFLRSHKARISCVCVGVTSVALLPPRTKEEASISRTRLASGALSVT